MLCPLLNAGRDIGSDAVLCAGPSCAWWLESKSGGGCAVRKLAQYLGASLKSSGRRGAPAAASSDGSKGIGRPDIESCRLD